MTEHEWWMWKARMLNVLIERDHAEDCSASGDVEDAVDAALNDPHVAVVAAEVAPGNRWLLGELRETGAWDDSELADHDLNMVRIVWGIACDWREETRAEARRAR